jgi:DNA-directed RNA polymerase subunit K/omega
VKPAIGLKVPELSKNFTTLASLGELPLGSTVDIIGIVTEISELYVTSFEDNDRWNIKITLTDESNAKVVKFFKKINEFYMDLVALQVIVLLTGQRALNFSSQKPDTVVAIKKAKVVVISENVVLAANSLSVMEVNLFC